MKKLVLSLLAASSLTAIMIACSKESQIVNKNLNNDSYLHKKEADMTLKEFANSRFNDYERDFLLNNPVVDNGNYFTNSQDDNIKKAAAKPPIRVTFRWHGTDPRSTGCVVPLGICFIIGLESQVSSGDFVLVNAEVADGKLIINFPESIDGNFGLTSDGFMPILENVNIPKSVASQLRLTQTNPHIKSGIYKAYFDEEKARFTGVALDLN